LLTCQAGTRFSGRGGGGEGEFGLVVGGAAGALDEAEAVAGVAQPPDVGGAGVTAAGVNGGVAGGDERLRPERGDEPTGGGDGGVEETRLAGGFVEVEEALPVGHETEIHERRGAEVARGETREVFGDVAVGAGDGGVAPAGVTSHPIQREGVFERLHVAVAAGGARLAGGVDCGGGEGGRPAVGERVGAGEDRGAVGGLGAAQGLVRIVVGTDGALGGEVRAGAREHKLEGGAGEPVVEILVAGEEVEAEIGERRGVRDDVAALDIPRALGAGVPAGGGFVAEEIVEVERGIGERAIGGAAVVGEAEDLLGDATIGGEPVAGLGPDAEAGADGFAVGRLAAGLAEDGRIEERLREAGFVAQAEGEARVGGGRPRERQVGWLGGEGVGEAVAGDEGEWGGHLRALQEHGLGWEAFTVVEDGQEQEIELLGWRGDEAVVAEGEPAGAGGHEVERDAGLRLAGDELPRGFEAADGQRRKVEFDGRGVELASGDRAQRKTTGGGPRRSGRAEAAAQAGAAGAELDGCAEGVVPNGVHVVARDAGRLRARAKQHAVALGIGVGGERLPCGSVAHGGAEGDRGTGGGRRTVKREANDGVFERGERVGIDHLQRLGDDGVMGRGGAGIERDGGGCGDFEGPRRAGGAEGGIV
jgi:hypothetical protein